MPEPSENDRRHDGRSAAQLLIKKPGRTVQRRVEFWPPLDVEQLPMRLSIGHATLISVRGYAGLRPGEALALSWADVGKRALRVTRSIYNGVEKRTKTGAARWVRLLEPVAEDLTAWRGDDHTARRARIPAA